MSSESNSSSSERPSATNNEAMERSSNQLPMTIGGGQLVVPGLKLGEKVPFSLLLPIIQSQLDRTKKIELHMLYLYFLKNQISEEVFHKNLRSMVGDKMLTMAVHKLQTQAPLTAQGSAVKIPSQPEASTRQLLASSTGAQITTALTSVDREKQTNCSSESNPSSSGRPSATNNVVIHNVKNAKEMERSYQLPMTFGGEQLVVPALKLGEKVPLNLLLDIILSQLDRSKKIELQMLYFNFMRNEISAEAFYQNLRSMVGDKMLTMAVLQTQAPLTAQDSVVQIQSQPEASTRQLLVSSIGAQITTALPSVGREKQTNKSRNTSDQQSMGPFNQQSAAMELDNQQPLLESRGNQQTMAMKNRYAKKMRTSCQQTLDSRISNQPAGATSKLNKRVVFGMVFPMIQPQLHQENEMRLQTLYLKAKRNEMSEDCFLRDVRSIIGDELVKHGCT